MPLDKKERKKLAFDMANELLEHLRVNQVPYDVSMAALAMALTKTALHVGIPHKEFVDRMNETYKKMSINEREDQSCH